MPYGLEAAPVGRNGIYTIAFGEEVMGYSSASYGEKVITKCGSLN
jgi:hypothetical protein